MIMDDLIQFLFRDNLRAMLQRANEYADAFTSDADADEAAEHYITNEEEQLG